MIKIQVVSSHHQRPAGGKRLMDKLRVGIVGSKFAAALHAECYSRNDKVEMVAVSE